MERNAFKFAKYLGYNNKVPLHRYECNGEEIKMKRKRKSRVHIHTDTDAHIQINMYSTKLT